MTPGLTHKASICCAILLMGLAGALAGCTERSAGGIELSITNSNEPFPVSLRLDWLDASGALFRNRAIPVRPAVGSADPIAVVRIETSGAPETVRWAIVRGLNVREDVISSGAVKLTLPVDGWKDVSVRLVSGQAIDRDGDGVPDSVDDCPADPTRHNQCDTPGSAQADAGSPSLNARSTDIRDADSPAAIDAPSFDAPVLADVAGTPPSVRDASVGSAPEVGPVDASVELPQRDAMIDAFVRLDRAPPQPPMPIANCKALLAGGMAAVDEPADNVVRARLVQMGCQVKLQHEGTFIEANAAGMTIVIVSATAGGSPSYTWLRAAAVPVLNLDKKALPDLRMTNGVENTDWGETAAQTSVTVSGTHPLSAGLAGTIALTDTPYPFGWATPMGTLSKVATLATNSKHAVLFGWEKDAPMVGLSAPARRVAYLPEEAAFPHLTEEGWQLFDAAVRWAQGK